MLSSESWTRIRGEEESRLVDTGEEARDEASELAELVERGLGGGMPRGGGASAQAIIIVAGRMRGGANLQAEVLLNLFLGRSPTYIDMIVVHSLKNAYIPALSL